MTPAFKTRSTESVFAELIFPLALRKPLVYSVPESFREQALPGQVVIAPLGSRKTIGILLKTVTGKPGFATKDIAEILPGWQLPASHVKMIEWAAAYYLTPLGEVARHFLPPNPAQTKRKLEELPEPISNSPQAPALNEAQRKALETIRHDLEKPSEPILLHGVTGSGKTEVYIEAVRQVLRTGGQALILVPEIGLTPQTTQRFSKALGPMASYHSAMTPAARTRVWRDVLSGKVRVVIATRSGVFLPYHHLKLIVVDEEHDSSYKQEDRFCYHARDLALWKAREEKLAIILGSATPSLESLHRVREGKIRKLELPLRAVGRPPELRVIDRRLRSRHPSTGYHSLLSEELLEALGSTLRRREQSLLFLNRRGFAPFVLCKSCGFVPECLSCDIAMSLHHAHHAAPALLCHYCDRTTPFASHCPKCPDGLLAPQGSGTERIGQELRRSFPSARIERLDRDASRGRSWEKILDRMRRHEIDILIGTQMITKGHDYPHLTLVGILDADQSLHIPDFRATERTYQLITQVSGRAGRSEKKGAVLIQSYQPEHPGLAFALKGDLDHFLDVELRERKEAGYPPFQRLIELRLSGKNRVVLSQTTHRLAEKLHAALPRNSASILGPAPCSIEKVRDSFRWHLLIKTPSYTKIHACLHRLLDDFAEIDLRSGVRMLVNVDPAEMM